VGIAGDVLINLDRQAQPTMYVSLNEGNWTNFYAVIHTSSDPVSMAAAVRREITDLDPDIPAFEVRTMSNVLDVSAARRQFTVMLLSLFAGLAVVLAGVGLYGVLSYAVAQRSSEIGIRMALGAAQSQVYGLILLEGMRPAILGVILGMAGAAWTTRFLQSLLFGVTAGDTVTFVTVPLLLLAVAVAACWIPAWRATRVDPAIALRSD